MIKQTTGPWHIGKDLRIIGADNERIARIDNNINVDGLTNARLIAAAPDMLEALENLIMFPLGNFQVEAARKAISKAKGEI
jgi:hypothetical protein